MPPSEEADLAGEIANPTIAHTLNFIRRAHGAQRDWTDQPYWLHPAAVMALLPPSATHSTKLAALLHDVVEDTNHTLDSLREQGYGSQVIEMVRLLTFDATRGWAHGPEGYLDQIRALILSGNRGAIQIKLADNLHNGDLARINSIILPNNRVRMEKRLKTHYLPARALLINALVGLGYKEI